VGLFWVLGHSGVHGIETDDEFARKGTIHQFGGPEPALGVSRKNIREKIKPWIDRQPAHTYGNVMGVLPVLRDKLEY
jgi:hypothetical protein